MAGMLVGVPLTQNVDVNGRPFVGCKLYIYAAGTTRLVQAYKTSALDATLMHPMPIPALADSRIPMFWLEDGVYRVRLVDPYTTTIYDYDAVPTVAAAGSPASGGGGGSTTISAFETGDADWQPRVGLRSGWVRHNGKTLGSSVSGATERASADCELLFTFMWNNYSNTLCPVSGGRGADAASDWAAHKTITLLDMRGITNVGLDDMGNVAAGSFTGVPIINGSFTTSGSRIGASRNVLSLGQLPTLIPSGTITMGGNYSNGTVMLAGGAGGPGTLAAGSGIGQGTITINGASFSASFAGNELGNNEPHNNTQLSMPGTWYCRL